ncbi:hypothetical protein LCGC14_2512280 [marine sediment metagenome]|uniref:Uncharacterized protein n=1 Tax=marine sediment metagenome TaxID=412755 RepID=A0A0F9DAL5_9ZZZZ
MKLDQSKSPPKLALIDFINRAQVGIDYTFLAPIPVSKADNFVHRMRVELSRFREILRQKSRTPKHFKVLFIKAEKVTNASCKITLRKSLSGHDVSSEIQEVWEALDGGGKINV